MLPAPKANAALDAPLPPHALLPLRPGERPTPWTAWLAAILVGVLGSLGILVPKAGIAVVVALFTAWVFARTIERPLRGVFIALWIFPFYPLVRGAIWCYYPTLSLFASRFWLEIILTTIGLGVLLRVLIQREKCRLVEDDLPAFGLLVAGLYGLIPTFLDKVYIDVVFGIYYCLTPIFAYFAVRWIRATPVDMRRVYAAVLTTYGVLAFLSFIDYALHPAFMLRIYGANRDAFYSGGVDNIRQIVTQVYLRMTSLLLEENHWGALSSFVSLLCAARLATGHAKRSVYVVFGMAVLGLILSMSRGALVGWIGGILFLIALHRQRRLRALFIVLLLVSAAVGVYLVLRTDPRIVQFVQRIYDATGNKNTWSHGNYDGRSKQWEEGIRSFQRFPSGIGVGSSGFSTMYTGARATIVTDGHYFHIAVDQGVIGIILWGLGLPGILWVLWKRAQSATDPELRSLGVGLCAGFVSLCVHGLSGNVFDYYYTPPLFFLLFGLYINVTNRREALGPKATLPEPKLLPAPAPRRPGDA